ncbi:MAG: SurA N-terminal domain-containing protein, partial [Holosporales bacterium]|nr:SurA N-terminal domain-containing protein [Holosporales bacterium]
MEASTSALAASPDAPAVASASSNNARRKAKGATIVAKVGKDVITNADVLARCMMIAVFSNQSTEPNSNFIRNIRSQVIQKLIDEAVYGQIAARSKLDIDDSDINNYVKNYSQQCGMLQSQFEEILKKQGILATFKKLAKAKIIASVFNSSACQSDLARVTEQQITKRIDEITANDSKTQYSISEIVFYSKGNVAAEHSANKTFEEIQTQMNAKAAPNSKIFQDFAQQLSQAPTAQNNGHRGWVVEDELDGASKEEIKKLKLGTCSRPVKVRNGEYRIYFLNDIKQPGHLPYSDTTVDLCVVTVPYNPSIPQNEQESIQRRVNALMICTSEQELKGTADE